MSHHQLPLRIRISRKQSWGLSQTLQYGTQAFLTVPLNTHRCMCVYMYIFERQFYRKERWERFFHLLTHCDPNGHNGWSWASLKTGSWSFLWIPSMGPGAHVLGPYFAALLEAHQWGARAEVERAGPKPNTECGHHRRRRFSP